MMDTLIDKFANQLEEALVIGQNATINKPTTNIQNVYVAGLGGSGIGGDFVAEYIYNECPIPYNIGKSYTVPNWVNKHTLAIASSYSGNTEETLAAYNILKEKAGKVIVISSGGKLIDMAKADGFDYIEVPSNWPSPRACLGYSLVAQLAIMHRFGFTSDIVLKQVKGAANLLRFNQDEIKADAKVLAKFLYQRIPVIYATAKMETIAIRFRQQINENAKQLCWHHVIPEMNHNEIVGWRQKNDKLAVVLFRNKNDFNRNSVRMDITKDVTSKYTPNIVELWSRGNNHVEQSLYYVHLSDYASYYLSEMNEVDSIEVEVINQLKGKLNEL